MTDSNNEDEQLPINDFVHDSVVTYANPVDVVFPRQCDAGWGPRLLREQIDRGPNPLLLTTLE